MGEGAQQLERHRRRRPLPQRVEQPAERRQPVEVVDLGDGQSSWRIRA
jgi:hypothetical protein